MLPIIDRPVWACPAWGPEHNWHECPDCLEEYELIIEKAQEWGESPNDAACLPESVPVLD
jgi:hypothetical protein